MGAREAVQMGDDGTIKIPIDLRQGFGMDAGTTVVLERTEEGILIRPAVAPPLESYTPGRKAEFLPNNASDLEDRRAVREVRGLGIEPDEIPHKTPTRY
ncbi:MAG TPA: AbrB/MazE/SpoVT family DNA-binding domain-containing protein [Longimicrobium sp.]|nr:AbrB/MazE/SpoVT family DNA-binding domain-containing protein [Longimicrobium sp.]